MSNQRQTNRRNFLKETALYSTATLGIGSQNILAHSSELNVSIPKMVTGFVGPQYYDNKEEELLKEVLESGAPFRFAGPGNPPNKVNDFEVAFAKYMETKFGLAVTSGTTALNCAMTALGIGPGDEVIIPAYTWWSDYTCIVHACALPVFADIDETFNLDPKSFEKAITPRTKAVIAVHLLGGPCDMDPIMEIAKKHNILVIEDCAQCAGGSYKGKKLGSIGDVAIFSFNAYKIITCGDGGAFITNDPVYYERAARYQDMGNLNGVFEKRIGGKSEKNFTGENYRMNEFSGAVMSAQLSKFDRILSDQRRNATMIYDGIRTIPGIRLRKQPDPAGDIGYSVFFDATSKEKKDQCLKALRQKKVSCSSLSGSVLLPTEESIMNKRTRHPNWPSFTTPEGKAIQYNPDICRQTLDVYDRFIQVRVGPKFTEEADKYIINAIKSVYSEIV